MTDAPLPLQTCPPEDDYDYKDRLSFLAEWFDYRAALLKNFLLNFYPVDSTVELFDQDSRKTYLKRSSCEGLSLKDMFVGNTIRVYGKQLKINGYADCHTERTLATKTEHTFAVIKPSAMGNLGEVIAAIEDREFRIVRMRMCVLTRKEALDFYESKKGDAFLPFMLEHLVSGPIVALELLGVNAIERWKKLLGPTDPAEARKSEPTSLRAIYGVEKASNGFHAADNFEQAVSEACFFFPQGIDREPPPSTAQITNCTCCVIKPHAIAEGKLGYILTEITNSAKFKITAMRMFYLSTPNADEYLEVYKGVVSDYHALLASFLDGPCVALEIAAKVDNIDTQKEFREFAGPNDSDIAKQIRPNSLRGKFGVNKCKNAIHCTDLPEDTELELDYFFKILDKLP